MTKRFVVGVSGLTPDQEKKFAEYLRAEGVAWWHWIPNFWLIKNKHETLTVKTIISGLKAINGDMTCLVMEIFEDVTWAILQKSNKDMAKWLQNTWRDS